MTIPDDKRKVLVLALREAGKLAAVEGNEEDFWMYEDARTWLDAQPSECGESAGNMDWANLDHFEAALDRLDELPAATEATP